MKKIFYILLPFLALHASAATNINTPYVQGHWTTAGSPYMIQNDVTVDSGTSLKIDPGVEVIFTGLYKFNVTGILYAVGTEAQPINFHAQDTTGWYQDATSAGGWNGVHYLLYNSPITDTSAFQYCNISDVKDGPTFVLTNAAFYTARITALKNCSIFHCQSSNAANTGTGNIVWMDNNQGAEIGNCSIHDNIATFQITDVSISFGLGHIHDNTIYNNSASRICYLYGDQLFDHNELYGNHASIDGSTVQIEGGHVTVRKNKIHDNTSMREGAISAGNGIVDIDGNLICNNVSTSASCGITDGGGAIHVIWNLQGNPDSTSFTIRNNILANNFTNFYGGGIYVWSAKTTIMNNTIINNSATQGGAGIYVVDTTAVVLIKNNIFYGNLNVNTGQIPAIDSDNDVQILTAKEIQFDNNWSTKPYSKSIYITPSSFVVNKIGDTTHNLMGTDPGLVSPTLTSSYTESALTANFDLKPTSSCINTGDTTGACATAVDYGDNTRISGTTIDVGAYEYHAPQAVATAHAATNSLLVYPNPATGSVNVSLPEANGTVRIEDISGRTIAVQNVTGKSVSLDIRSIPAGVYFIKWESNNQRSVQKLIVQ